MTYLYLDDETEAAVGPIVRRVTDFASDLEIRHEPPVSYPEQLKALEAASFDGLILDMRLDQFPNWKVEGEQADYRAATLAQELRTRATEAVARRNRSDWEVPIALWSSEKKLDAFYDRDDTSHDLFDLTCVKGRFEEEDYARQTADRLVSLVEGYRRIVAWRDRRGPSRLPRLLGLDAYDFLDSRLVEWFAERPTRLPAHEYARFLIRALIRTPGPLISRSVLAARLGVDLDRSPAFDAVVEAHFSDAVYTGPFAAGWPRWWGSLVESAWRALDVAGPLRSLSAEKRVDVLRGLGADDIEPAEPMKPEYSAAFWTVCRGTERPLDPRDGFVLSGGGRYPWETSRYVSLYAFETREADQKGLRVSPLEADRFARAKQTLHSERASG